MHATPITSDRAVTANPCGAPALATPDDRSDLDADGVGLAVGRGDGGWLDHLDRQQLCDLIATMPVIEQAKGLLMGHLAIRPEQAFAILRRWSSTRNIKLRELCAEIVEAGQNGMGQGFGGLAGYITREHCDGQG